MKEIRSFVDNADGQIICQQGNQEIGMSQRQASELAIKILYDLIPSEMLCEDRQIYLGVKKIWEAICRERAKH